MQSRIFYRNSGTSSTCLSQSMANFGFNSYDDYVMCESSSIGVRRLLMYDMLGVYLPRLIQV